MALQFTEKELLGLTKKEVVCKYMELNRNHVNLLEKMDIVSNKLDDLSGRIEVLESSLEISSNANSLLVSQVKRLESELHRMEQYSRRECLEFVGIPANVEDEELEGKVIDILDYIDVPCAESDIEACHRLKNNRTIVKFGSRKTVFKIFKNKIKLRKADLKSIGVAKVFINESLCPYYRGIWSKAKQFRDSNKIFSFYVSNGTIKIKKFEDSVPVPVFHDSDLLQFDK